MREFMDEDANLAVGVVSKQRNRKVSRTHTFTTSAIEAIFSSRATTVWIAEESEPIRSGISIHGVKCVPQHQSYVSRSPEPLHDRPRSDKRSVSEPSPVDWIVLVDVRADIGTSRSTERVTTEQIVRSVLVEERVVFQLESF
jgi:hypothetical protein